MLNPTIRTWDDLYLQIAKLAKESGNEQMFKLALANRGRTLRKEMEQRRRQANAAPVSTLGR